MNVTFLCFKDLTIFYLRIIYKPKLITLASILVFLFMFYKIYYYNTTNYLERKWFQMIFVLLSNNFIKLILFLKVSTIHIQTSGLLQIGLSYKKINDYDPNTYFEYANINSKIELLVS